MEQFDEIINCPKSGGEICYRVQVTNEVSNYMSLSCGFITNTLMKEGEELYEQSIETVPELYKDLAWTDPETGMVWLPNTINVEDVGMVFPYGNNKDNSYNIVNNYTYSKNTKLEILVNVYSNEDNLELYNNEILESLYFTKDISKTDLGNWEEYYNYIKPLIKEKLHNEIQNYELYRLLDISSHLEDV